MNGKPTGNVEPVVLSPRAVGKIWIELLTMAALCAATIGLIAGVAAALLAGS